MLHAPRGHRPTGSPSNGRSPSRVHNMARPTSSGVRPVSGKPESCLAHIAVCPGVVAASPRGPLAANGEDRVDSKAKATSSPQGPGVNHRQEEIELALAQIKGLAKNGDKHGSPRVVWNMTWKGYSRYAHTVAHSLSDKGAGVDQKADIIARLLREKASCFWKSAFMAVRPFVKKGCAFERLMTTYSSDLVVPKEGVDMTQALAFLKGTEIGIYRHNPYTGVVDSFYSPPGKWKPGVMLVLCSDDGRTVAHWLPVAGLIAEPGSMIFSEQEKMEIDKAHGLDCAKRTKPSPLLDASKSKGKSRLSGSSTPSLVTQNQFSVLGEEELPEARFLDLPGILSDDLSGTQPGGARTYRSDVSSVDSLSPAELREMEQQIRAALGVRAAVAGPQTVRVFDTPALPFCRVVSDEPSTDGLEQMTERFPPNPPPPPPPIEYEVVTDPPRVDDRVVDLRLPLSYEGEELEVLDDMPFSGYIRGEEAPPVSGLGPFGMLANWFGAKTDEDNAYCIRRSGMPQFICDTTSVQDFLPPVGPNKCWWSDQLANYWPHLVEARDYILKSTPLRTGDLVYTRMRDPHLSDPNLLAGGAYQLRALCALHTDSKVFDFGPVRVLRLGGRHYEVAALRRRGTISGPLMTFLNEMVFRPLYLNYFCPFINQLTFEFPWLEGPFARIKKWCDTLLHYKRTWSDMLEARRIPHTITLVDQIEPAMDLAALDALPSDAAKVRTGYAYIKPHLPEECQGPFRNCLGEQLALENPASIEPKDVARAHVRFNEACNRAMNKIKGFANVGGRHPRTCVSCGCEPPEGKYRWKHRVCNQCRRMLTSVGHTTWAGSQLQENLQIPTCYPGLTYIAGRQLPPARKKWEGVDTSDPKNPGHSLVKVCYASARVKQEFGDRGIKWVDMEKTDLQKVWEPDPKKWLAALAGIACSGAIPMVSASTNFNRGKALMGRVFRKQAEAAWGPGPKPGRWEWAKMFIQELLPDFEAEPMTVSDWLATMPSYRRKPLERAAMMYAARGLKDSDGFTKSFIKCEFLPGFVQKDNDLWELEEMLDRLIQAPADITHVVAGPVLKPLVTLLKKIWHADNPLIYGSAGPEALHKLLMRLVDGDGTFFWCDFSMFDNTHSVDSWDFMESLYKCHDRDFRRVMDMWRKPKGFIGPFKYQAHVMNASGRDDTALANGILNGFATTLSVAAAYLKIELDELTIPQLREVMSKLTLSVCGDDSIGKLPPIEKSLLPDFERRVAANIREFGFETKLQTSSELLDAVYLGMRPYPTKKGWFWGKTIGRSTYKMGWVLKPETRDVMAHITGVADMHCLCSAHVPILSDLAEKIIELRQGAKRSPVALDPNKPWEWTLCSGVKYDELTIEAVAQTYSRLSGTPVSTSDVYSLIHAIKAIDRLPAVIDHPLWRLIICTDDL